MPEPLYPSLPILTPRLCLRGPEPKDSTDITTALEESRPELQRWLNWATPWPSQEETEKWLLQSITDFKNEASHVRFEGFDRQTERFLISLGCTRMNSECFHISYWARTSAAGNGYVTEAVNALSRYLFDVCGAKRLETGYEIGNIASQRVLEKCGFEYEKDWDNHIANKPGLIRKEKLYVMNKIDQLPPLEVTYNV